MFNNILIEKTLTQKYKYIVYNNVDLLPPVVAMHACIVLGLCEHDIPTACDVESRRCW
jgi:hypothetical protein